MEGTKMFDFLFGKNKDQYASEYDTAINNAKQERADAAYNYRYNKALYDTNKDYFDKIGVKDPSASYWNDNGQRTNDFTETMNQYGKYLNDLNKEKEDVAWKNRYNIFGDGAIGNLLNPFHQAGTAVQDFVSSGTKEWDNGNRDILSDLGAIGESALTAAPLAGGLLKTGGGVAKAGAKTLGKTLAKGAGAGATYGALGGLTDMGAKNFDLGSLLGRTAIGGTVGAGMSGVGYGLGKVGDKLANIAKNNRTTATTENVASQLYDDMGNPIAKNGVSYQDALKKAGLDQMNNPADYQAISNIMGGGSIPEDWANNPGRVQNLTNKINTFVKELGGKTNTSNQPGLVVYDGNNLQSLYDALNRIKTIPRGDTTTPVTTYTTTGLSNKRLGQIGQGIGDLIKNLPGVAKDELVKAKNSNLGKSTSKIGTNVANLLKTKKGKVLLGGTAGLTLAGLMKNRKDNNTGQLSDEEMQELYNYVYGGQ